MFAEEEMQVEGEIDEQEAALERESFARVLRAYLDYQPVALSELRMRERQFDSLTAEHWSLLYDERTMSEREESGREECVTDVGERARRAKRAMYQHLEHMKMAAFRNTEFISFITSPHQAALADEAADELEADRRQNAVRSKPSDIDKVRSTLKQFARDWAVQGRRERRQCYGPILDELQRRFPVKAMTAPTRSPLPATLAREKLFRESASALGDSNPHSSTEDYERESVTDHPQPWQSSEEGEGEIFVSYRDLPPCEAVAVLPNEQEDMRRQRGGVRVLCPGAGLGRLCWEAARLGFDSQGNEFSYYMLLASSFILNSPHEAESYRVFPWIHTLSNAVDHYDQLRPVTVPDLLPSQLPPQAEFSMCAGDFLEAYTEPNSWDCVMTCFFIDTAHNVVEYVKTIARILRPGGCWINLGPLLYHWADMAHEQSIELSLEQVKTVARNCGLTIDREEALPEATYCANVSSMMQTAYRPHFFVATK